MKHMWYPKVRLIWETVCVICIPTEEIAGEVVFNLKHFNSQSLNVPVMDRNCAAFLRSSLQHDEDTFLGCYCSDCETSRLRDSN